MDLIVKENIPIILPPASATKEEVRGFIVAVEEAVKKLPGAFEYKTDHEGPFVLKHSFAPGVYARELSVPAGMLVVTKIHKQDHHVFVLKGVVSCYSEHGYQRVSAPCSFISPKGIKRLCFIHEDTVWTTIHATNETNIDRLDNEIAANSYEELGIPCADIKLGELSWQCG